MKKAFADKEAYANAAGDRTHEYMRDRCNRRNMYCDPYGVWHYQEYDENGFRVIPLHERYDSKAMLGKVVAE